MKTLEDLWASADGLFWLVVAIALTLKLLLSESFSKRKALYMVVSGVFCAAVLTGPLIDFMKLDSDRYKYAIAGLLALVGEHLVRRVVKFSETGTIADIKKGLTK